MISMQELLGSYNLEDQPTETQANLAILLDKSNKIRTAWGKPMTVTSGLRSMEDHLRIYREKGITDLSKIPLHSKHLYGQAVDIFDPDLSLTAWLKGDGAALAEEVGLWFEEGNANWAHMQIVPPGSQSRWFLP